MTPEQVAAARAYVLNNPTTVLDRHLEIEARMAIGNPPEVIEQAKHTHAVFLRFQEWVIKRKEDEPLELAAEAADGNGRSGSFEFPSFREWMKEQESRPLSISDAQRAELERRSAEDDCFPDDVIPWEQVKADLCSRLR